MNCVEIWSFELLIFKGMTLVEHMQNSSPPDLSDWMPYHTPLIPWFWAFSWLCASNVCTPFRHSYAFDAKIYNICLYQYHRKIMLLCGFHWHCRYSIWISTLVLFDCVCFKANSVWTQEAPVATKCTKYIRLVLHLLICHDNWFIASRLAWMPNVHCILG